MKLLSKEMQMRLLPGLTEQGPIGWEIYGQPYIHPANVPAEWRERFEAAGVRISVFVPATALGWKLETRVRSDLPGVMGE